jgi:hypothetical protein
MVAKKTAISHLKEWAEIENRALSRNLLDLSKTMETYEALYQLAGTLILHMRAPLKQKKQETYAAVNYLLQLILHDLTKGSLVLLRGHGSDASFHFRRVIETCAIIIELLRDESKAEIWFKPASKDGSDKRYLQSFRIFKLVKDNLSEFTVSYYEILCLYVHPSLISHAAGKADEQFKFRFFETETATTSKELNDDLLMSLRCVYLALKDVGQEFEKHTSFDAKRWQRACTEFDDQLDKVQ